MEYVKPILIFGYGNASRGDDALGPLLLDFIQERLDLSQVEIQTDFQLQIEHALDLVGRHLVLFVDASVGCPGAFEFVRLTPARDKSFSTHAMSPTSVLQVYQDIEHATPPPSFLLSIKGDHFELGAPLSRPARIHLQQAKNFTELLLNRPVPKFWQAQAESMAAQPDVAEKML
ncbi:MAG: hydrogenase maturation protease [Gammaproteobacteria bacterium]